MNELGALLLTVVTASCLIAVLEEGMWPQGKWKPSSWFLECLVILIVWDLILPFSWGNWIRIIFRVSFDLSSFTWLFHSISIVWILGILWHGSRYMKSLLQTFSVLNLLVKEKADAFYRDVPVYIISYLDGPMVVGWKKAIFLPEGDWWKDDFVLAHEYEHLLHHDFWLKQSINLLCIIYWWFPLVWKFQKKTELILELRIDRVLTKKMKNEERLRYAKNLMTYAKLERRSYLASSLFGSNKSSALELRVQKIIFSDRFFRKDLVILMLCGVFLMVGKITDVVVVPVSGIEIAPFLFP
ncbi:M56 family metallopeptidase [Dubosiella newyorkensis]|jgi:beta-lactamase regulating signal transducer with metallopeptidase domain|uniref:M56 family metallopeptidase n=1 Tax=Dubosiella newyorkensis TaxID=1862672 RepID=UPI0023540EE2|nr:M56 family metallopeptidase [Dubosiella newyorkensis]MCI9041005.1 M56 family metallopeptidase [Dubosiella newyorkensis]